MGIVLVTGAGGYVGRHCVRALVDRGADVVAVHRTACDLDPRCRSLLCDLTELNAARLREVGPIDAVLHLAWSNGFDHNTTSHIDDLPAHLGFVRAALDAGVSRFAGMGTMHEIGYWEGMVREDTPAAPRNYYGIAKNALREATRIAVERADAAFLWLRAYYILGDDLRNQSIFAKILRAEAEGRATFPFTSGTSRYDFIMVDALADHIAAACLQQEVRGVIECCSGVAVPLRERVEQFLRENSLNIRLDYGAFPDRPYDSPAIWGDASKIRAILSSAASAEQDNVMLRQAAG